MKKMFKNAKGQSIAEFALVFPVFILLIMGIFQMAFIGVSAILLDHAAFVTARIGIVSNDEGTMLEAAYQAIPFNNKQDIALEILSDDEDPELIINLSYKVPLFFPVVNVFLKKALSLSELKFPLKTNYLLPKESFAV